MKIKHLVIILSAILVATLLSLSAYSLFSGGKCTVTFDANGGTLNINSADVKQGATVELPIPAREGYVFIGWYLGEGINEERFRSTNTVTADITLIAKWINEEDILNSGVKIDIHTVTYNTNGGAIEGETTIYAQTYSMINLPTPTMEGHVFLGWYFGEGANEALFTSSSLVTTNITLNAKWAKAEHTVTFLDYYGEVIAREKVKHAEAVNAPAVPRVAEKKLRFDAWDKDLSSITEDMTVQALYVIDSYSITYVTNNNQTIPTTSYFFDETPREPKAPVLAGHYFVGWYLDEEFTQKFEFNAPLTKDVTLYAYFNTSIPISTLDELLALEQYTTEKYFLLNDIDCESAVITSSILDFTGVLDGSGHRIYNFVFQPASAADVGFFSTNAGTIKDLIFDNFSYSLDYTNVASNIAFVAGKNVGTIENVHISNATISYTLRTLNSNITCYCGTIAGYNSGSIINCTAESTSLYLGNDAKAPSNYYSGLLSDYVGLLAGANKGTIDSCYTDITVTHDATTSHANISSSPSEVFMGGITSINEGAIYNSNAANNIVATTSNHTDNDLHFGGLVHTNSGEIVKCYATPKIDCGDNFNASLAGLAVTNNETITDCYANVDFVMNKNSYANTIAAGFVATNNGGLYNCYAAGKMDIGAANLGKGGFVATNNGNITSCFADVTILTTSDTAFGPFVGIAGTASYITNCYYGDIARFLVNGAPATFEETYATVTASSNFIISSFILDTLGWNEEIWAFDESGYDLPSIK